MPFEPILLEPDRDERSPLRLSSTGSKTTQIQVDPLVKSDGIAVAARLPIAGEARLDQKPLALVVVVSRDLSRQCGTRAHDAHPFCQDEKTRLPAEMLRLDS